MQQKNYSPIVLFHYRNPQNFGKLNRPTHTFEALNPLCGDEIKVYLQVRDDRVADMKYEARGCAISIAAASVLSEKIKNKKYRLTEIEKITKSDIEQLLKIKVSSARESCVTLTLSAIKKTINLSS